VIKTTLAQQIIQHLLDDGVSATHILRVQFEDLPTPQQEPILRIAYWFEQHILGKPFNTVAHEGQLAYLFFDELQNISFWAPQLKYLVDLNSVRVMITGSSALGQDSLAGRLSTIEMGPLFLREIAALREWGDIPAFLPFNGFSQLKRQSFWQLSSFLLMR
jgi:predicted AAA+ superfamily ATPase